MTRLLLASLLAISLQGTVAYAQQSAVPPETLRELSADLADIQRAMAKAYQSEQLPTAPTTVKVTSDNATVLSGANSTAKPLGFVGNGTNLKILDKVGEYYAVQGTGAEKWTSGWIKADNVVPTSAGFIPAFPPPTSPGVLDQIFDEAMAKLEALKVKYDKNKYVRVSGFSITLGIPPSATVDFELK